MHLQKQSKIVENNEQTTMTKKRKVTHEDHGIENRNGISNETSVNEPIRKKRKLKKEDSLNISHEDITSNVALDEKSLPISKKTHHQHGNVIDKTLFQNEKRLKFIENYSCRQRTSVIDDIIKDYNESKNEGDVINWAGFLLGKLDNSDALALKTMIYSTIAKYIDKKEGVEEAVLNRTFIKKEYEPKKEE